MSLPRADRKAIAKIIAGLPVMYSKTETEHRAYFGSVLIAQGKKQRDGSSFDPNKSYTLKVAKQIDHQKEAERCFAEGGIERVNKYVEQILDVNGKHAEKKEIISLLTSAFTERKGRF